MVILTQRETQQAQLLVVQNDVHVTFKAAKDTHIINTL